MERRRLLAASIAVSTLAVTGDLAAQVAPGLPAGPRQFYQLRRYTLQQGPQTKQVESYFANALIPALNRMSFAPVGALRLDIGPETPSYFLLIPAPDIATLAMFEARLPSDPEFLRAAAPFWNATAAAPPFQRAESSLLVAFEGWPRLTPPSSAATRARRIFQLRTYESPSNGAHVRKIEMFHSGEFQIFLKAGFHPVFFADTLIGARMPNLTYMLSFADQTELDAKWELFRNDPEWKRLSTSPRYASDQIVTNITNLILSPLDCSQI